MKPINFIIWECSSASNAFSDLELLFPHARILRSKDLLQLKRWLEDLLFSSFFVADFRNAEPSCFEDLQNISRNPKMWGIPVFLYVSKKEVSQFDLFKLCHDFVVEPAEKEEIKRRLSHLLETHRPTEILESIKPRSLGAVQIDWDLLRVKRGKEEVKLTPLEFKLLQYFCFFPNRILSRHELLSKIWGYERNASTRTLDTYIKRLRSKLGEEGKKIETVRGTGYRLQGSEV